MQLEVMIARLRANGEVLAALGAGVTDEQARWRPEPSKWSILEVVNHLADEEVEDFRTRLDLTLHRPGAAWPPIDPEGVVAARRYNERGLAESLDRFLSARRDSIAWLAALERPDWALAYDHPKAGRITAGDLLTSWVAHDHIHIRQLNRLHREYLVTELSGHAPEYAGRW